MDYIRCNQCNGNRSFSPLGFITKDCFKCNGIGYIESKPELKSVEFAPKDNDLPDVLNNCVQKKRGRPKQKN